MRVIKAWAARHPVASKLAMWFGSMLVIYDGYWAIAIWNYLLA
ncbi:hypothetical protein ABQJ54_11210 [Rhodanobacter sp. Si-c]|uniref:Uncharacterized protein n=1 Tax=Rhodanobacter lycopersici TaxID=3162487 RepID=A0ABV3QEY8_9GAMM